MEGNLVKVDGLFKSYDDHTVLSNVSFVLDTGHVVGLLGPNGCGKTSLIKIMTGLIHDYSGNVRIGGQAPGEFTKGIVAYLPEKTYLHDWMRTIDAVDYFADFYSDFDRTKALDMVRRFDLPEKQKAKSMSKGMQEKLQLLLVMCRNARLYLLDEPLGGVDPAARSVILDVILGNYSPNSTILLSTHLINDMERILDHVLFLGNGTILIDEDAESLRRKSGKSIEETFKEVFGYAW
ncbi:MAG: ABC transporter ATP-binding protein [Clostridiales bacterium]|jgi:ABC-2 type transport system ATP-binding protein|nr:ABC transporter ATP-binding protein [Clostridiales bacterium]